MASTGVRVRNRSKSGIEDFDKRIMRSVAQAARAVAEQTADDAAAYGKKFLRSQAAGTVGDWTKYYDGDPRQHEASRGDRVASGRMVDSFGGEVVWVKVGVNKGTVNARIRVGYIHNPPEYADEQEEGFWNYYKRGAKGTVRIEEENG